MTRSCPFHLTTAPDTKFVPVTVKVSAPLFCAAAVGERALTIGTGLTPVTVKLSAVETPPPGPGWKTVTGTTPTVAKSAARICARSSVGPWYVVTRSCPFHLTTAPDTKFAPVTVRVSAPLFCPAVVGERALKTGAGFCAVTSIDPVRSQTRVVGSNCRMR